MKKFTLTTLAAAILLSACGGSSNNDSNNSETPVTAPETTVSVGISDAPVNNLAEVNLVIEQLTFRSANNEDVVFDTLDEQGNPIKVNLLDYTGDAIYQLIDEQQINPGDYEWIRADIVNGEAGSNFDLTSSVRFNDGSQAPLAVTRKANDGVGEIQLNDFSLNEGANELVLEFDLNKALLKRGNSNTVYLKPTAVRLENVISTFDVSGTVTTELQEACIADNSDLAPEQGEFKHVVYLYNASVAEPGDISEQSNSPLATAMVDSDNNYELAFIATGEYKLAYSCLGHIDDAESEDENFSLYQQQDITVEQDLTVSFTVTAE